MADQEDEELTEEAKQLLRKTRVPHKFCPYCGTRNEADAQNCANCGKDISWMRIPEPIPYSEAPKEKPRSLPEQQKIFTPRVILVIAIIVALLFAFVLVILLVTRGKSAELLPASGILMALGLCVSRFEVRPFHCIYGPIARCPGPDATKGSDPKTFLNRTPSALVQTKQ